MKVTKGQANAFKPVTLVLESQVEVDMLYHLSNISRDDNLYGYCGAHSVDIESLSVARSHLFYAIHDYARRNP